jgi:hypothetical protein
LTETPSVEAALRTAAGRWPEDRDNPDRLLRRLIDRGAEAISEENAAAQPRAEVVERTAGQFTGVFGPGYLDALRDGSP